jgi:hypothetical protein
MFSVTSGVYDGQSLAAEECDAMGRQVKIKSLARHLRNKTFAQRDLCGKLTLEYKNDSLRK